MSKDKCKTIIGIIGVWLHNHPDDKKHRIEFTTDELEYIKQALTELDELKRDVARYFELEKRLKYISENANTPYGIMDMKQSYRETLKELNVLEDKLSKVGKEE